MAGISANALKGMNYVENRKKYNGIEFTEDLELDIYDAQLRNLDPQIGRWNQVDPKIENMEMWSPYASNYDNPIRFNDFLGDEPDEGGPGPGALPAIGATILQKMDENLNAGVDAAMGALGDVGVSLGGLFNGMNQAASFGKYPSVSADQFGLNDRQTALYNKSTTVGALAPSVLPGGRPGQSPALAPVNGKPFQVLPYKVAPAIPQSQVNADNANNKSSSGKNEKHGDGGRAMTKAEKQIQQYQEQLKTAKGNEKKVLEKKMQNVLRDAQRKAKGEEHSRGNKR